MKTLVIVPCGQGKIWDKQPNTGPVPAKNAYTGAPFKVNREYAEHFADQWVILSAKYGFISPDFTIPKSYNVTFKKQSTNPVSILVLRKQVKDQKLHEFDVIIGLGGVEYRQMIEGAFAGTNLYINFPFAGLPLGMAMQATKKAIEANSMQVNNHSAIERKDAENTKIKSSTLSQLDNKFIDTTKEEPALEKTGPDIELVWSRIKTYEGQTFRQIRGGEFTYVVKGNSIYPDRTNVQISKASFQEALAHYPLTSTTKIQHLRGPSYIYAVLMDQRISG